MHPIHPLPLLLLLVPACSRSIPQETTPVPPAFQPTLSLTPLEAQAPPGGTVAFKALINYAPDGPRYIRQPVSFRVEEEGGGTVTLQGVYTAPARPGTWHVIARRDDFPQVQARATVTVRVP